MQNIINSTLLIVIIIYFSYTRDIEIRFLGIEIKLPKPK